MLARVVRERRVELGLRQDALADLAGVSTRFVHTLEAGKPTVQLDRVTAVLEVLGLELVVVPRQAGPLETGPPQAASER
jgi:HTH-type transcriptional regulator / antitoxin HipB